MQEILYLITINIIYMYFRTGFSGLFIRDKENMKTKKRKVSGK